jgi:hypothetical protein
MVVVQYVACRVTVVLVIKLMLILKLEIIVFLVKLVLLIFEVEGEVKYL